MNKTSTIFKMLSGLAITSLVIFGCEKDYKITNETPVSRSYTEEFDTVSRMYAEGWSFANFSVPQGTGTWAQGVFAPGKFGFDGFAAYSYKSSGNEYIYANYTTGNGLADCNTWMITPPLMMKNGDKISFYTRTIDATTFPDRLQVWLNPSDNTVDVGTQTALGTGKFTIKLIDINPTLTTTGYPETWTKYEATISGLPAVTVGIPRRVGFRYWVTGGGPSGNNSNYIGIDKFEFTAVD
jgi:hypothetical protein